jgi:mono/diheme cytochrome c family protein
MRWSIGFSLLLLVSLAKASEAAAAEVAVVFERSGKELKRLTPPQISALVEPKEIKLFDPHHGKAKSYRCWPIKRLMDAVYGKGWGEPPLTEAVLTAADGYASQAQAAKLREDGGCLAFEDLDAEAGRWEPIGRKQADPGPYYLVWTKPEQSAENAYPWPWQLASIDLVSFESRYPEVAPRGAKRGSPEHDGYMTFRALCLRCHSINREGGKIGPDLNAPQSVTAYRTKEWITSYVRQPSKYRYTEMPDHTRLSDRELETLYAYFKLKATQPEKSWDK